MDEVNMAGEKSRGQRDRGGGIPHGNVGGPGRGVRGANGFDTFATCDRTYTSAMTASRTHWMTFIYAP